MMGYSQKLQLSRNKHLKDSGYYDQLIFYLYLSQEQVCFNQSLTSWGMVTAGTAYAKGDNSVDNKAFFGNSTTISTFMKKTHYWRETMTESIYNCLKEQQRIVACIDNNQKGFAMKYQRFGNSNTFIKVTGCVIKRCFYFDDPIDDDCNNTIITYFQQNIPSSFNMSKYELMNDSKEAILDIIYNCMKPKQPYGSKGFEWKLSDNWQNKRIVLCLDGLSLDRHCGFCNKLLKLPISFTRAYQQSKIFQKALLQVVDISGPLHTAFHILQSIFIVYNCFLRCVQQCLGWKRITYSKVSENYRLYNHMVDIAYKEVFRFLIFTFVSNDN